MSLFEHVARELALEDYEVDRDVDVGSGVRVDAVLRTEDRVYLVEVKSQPLKRDDIAQATLYRDLWARSGHAGNVETHALLVVPGAGTEARRLAHAVDVDLVQVPHSLIPQGIEQVGTIPLTTEKSWAVVATVLANKRVKGVRDLARRTGVSTGWTHQVLGELQARQAIVRRGNAFELEDPEPILDAVASERPLSDLEVKRVATGLDSMDDLTLNLGLAWQEIRDEGGKPGLYLCGTSAAAHFTGTLVQGDRLDVYSDAVRSIEELFEGREGGITIRVFEPDHEIGTTSTFGEGLLCVSKPQALLDVAGTGMAFRDLTLEMLEVLQG